MKKKAYFVGHSHIDAVWLWDREETKDVVRDTFIRVLELLEKNKDFYFIQSSAQFYKWMEELYPEIFRKIKEYVKKGNWEITGGMWVEPDTNGISGESYARQIFYGKKYFREKFGIDVKLAWLPDSFGYPNTLPMILKEGGIDYFYTAKLNFEHPLHFPYYIFRWISPDDSEVIAVHTFRYEGNPVWKVIKNNIILASIMHPNYDKFMIVYGEGDHGGGISQEMLNNIKEIKERGIIEVETGKAIDYYRELDKKRDLFPVWNDELYLKTHQGTYTTQGNFRRKNRHLEGLLYKTEVYATIASHYGYRYPHREIDTLWELFLFNQFHDALAGSSIPDVYGDAWKDFDKVEEGANKIINEALFYIVKNLDAKKDSKSFLVFNPLNFPVSEILNYNGVSWYVKDIPPFGYKVVNIDEKIDPGFLNLKAGDGEIIIENEFLSCTISEETGLITSIYNKKTREEFLEAPGNLIQIYEDDDLVESAWNIHLGKEERLVQPETIRITKDTPFVKEVEVLYKYTQEKRPDTFIKLFISLDAFSPYIKVRLQMNLNTQKRTYKVAFPLRKKTNYTTYETPYGYIDRIDPWEPSANSIERCKTEAPGGKWIERGGFAIINDGRFGFDIEYKNTLRMTVARTVRYPRPLSLSPDNSFEDVYTDQGEMELSYLIYPHGSDWKKAEIPKIAWQFNVGINILGEKSVTPTERSLFTFSKEVIVTALKERQVRDGIVVRFFEPFGKDVLLDGDFIKSNILEDKLGYLKNPTIKPLSLNTFLIK